ncbi:type VII secretion integral membrane protein EccD [Nocardia sp. NBC_01503]|uniref:type VII secretion integral membrane protein EccD n=1 Tax=Nocardia sp. NBC_01503 TaxID=2975997 RepID=UPI002E7AEE11|nr:type VII secretion integral membrane protein EccD [Nocardia sp. NBC_01503]WTL29918.1 type VII secretion integral membrane protein EccD [Nocardia sp. NBC_01503]
MSAPSAVAAPPASAQQTAEVARARVAIMVASYQVDVVLPTKFSVETFMDDLISVLVTSVDDPTVDFTAENGHWTLARPGKSPLPRWSTLAEHDIADGALLLLTTTESAEAFDPLVEDITDALARVNEREFTEFDSGTAALTGISAFGAGALAISALLSWSWMRTGSVLWCAVPALVLGVLCVFAATALERRYREPRLGLGATLTAIPLLGVGAAMLVPLPYGQHGMFQSANLATGAAVAAVVTVIRLRSTRLGLPALLATAVLGSLLALAAAVETALDLSARQLAGAMVLAGLLLLTAAPRLAVLVARIRPPDLPDPGREVTHSTLTDIFDAETTGPGEEEQPAAQRNRATFSLESRARLAINGLRGLIIAAALLLAGAAVLSAALSPGGIREIIMAAAISGVLVMRARWYPDRVQAIALVAAAAATVVGIGFVLVGAYATAPARLVVVLVIAALATAGAVSGARLPAVRLSPVVRRIIDLIEYTFILAVPVLACWIMGIYTAMRGL